MEWDFFAGVGDEGEAFRLGFMSAVTVFVRD